MARLTTHVLDSAHGCPATGLQIELYRVHGTELVRIASAVTNDDGRCAVPLLEGAQWQSGLYQLQFDAGDYFRRRGLVLPDPAFLETVVVRFGLDARQGQYHVPLLLSPYGYSTYRGS